MSRVGASAGLGRSSAQPTARHRNSSALASVSLARLLPRSRCRQSPLLTLAVARRMPKNASLLDLMTTATHNDDMTQEWREFLEAHFTLCGCRDRPGYCKNLPSTDGDE
eukprot:m.181005 g.181005  ORF g.181005 m.181005 type:complete len:109 (-) comp9992_c0_seq34:141-467(-)